MLFQTNNPITNVRITNEIGNVFYNVRRNVDSGITLLEKKNEISGCTHCENISSNFFRSEQKVSRDDS